MTPVPSGPRDNTGQEREELAAVAYRHYVRSSGPGFIECACGWAGVFHPDHQADVLAAHVQAQVQAATNQRAAEELEDAAYAVAREAGYCYGANAGIRACALQDAAELVRARAAALAQPAGEAGR